MIVGMVGCGAIANTIVSEIMSEEGIEIKYFYDRDVERAENLARISNGVAVLNLEEMFDEVDLIVEAASPAALKDVAVNILENGIDLMIMSVGALMDEEFFNKVYSVAHEKRSKVYAPSGAIVGLDGIKAGSIGKITQASLTTRKAPKSLGREVTEEEVLFEGKASEAVKQFPVNINVAASLSIACGMDVDVKIIVDPKVDKNVHEVHVMGDFGELKTSSANIPFVANPKTSMLAAFSAIKLLKSFNECFSIGT
ncbi:aspartate dehydrogenase [uncultured Methanobrevibacter sp.]|uniref:aspartate dehydrogenase n=1 Tax=uncultured Methanobrevibacter sp. TaxID=253161 RepID=UPI00263458F3